MDHVDSGTDVVESLGTAADMLVAEIQDALRSLPGLGTVSVSARAATVRPTAPTGHGDAPARRSRHLYDVSLVMAAELDAEELEDALRRAGDTRRLRQPKPATVGTLGSGCVQLGEREAAILNLIATGLSNEEIARSLFLSPNTVKAYIRSAYRKIEVRSRSQAVRWVLHHTDLGVCDDG